MTKDKLPAIKYGTTPNILLLGNGINRAFEQSSWDALLRDITTVELSEEEKVQIGKMPYPLRPVVLTNDQIGEKLQEIAGNLVKTNVLERQRELLCDYTSLEFDAILTTNYSYEIEKAIDPEFYCKVKSNSKYRNTTKKGSKTEEQLGLFKYMKVSKDDKEYRVWHIHGEAARPASIVLGHYYYGKLLSKVQQYVPTVMARYEGSNRYKKDFQPNSWIDYFLIGNVHIVGFGLDFSEMDIWWLINCKKRNAKKNGKIYFYEPNLNKKDKLAKKLLADVYEVECVTKELNGKQYIQYYESLLDDIKDAMEHDL